MECSPAARSRAEARKPARPVALSRRVICKRGWPRRRRSVLSRSMARPRIPRAGGMGRPWGGGRRGLARKWDETAETVAALYGAEAFRPNGEMLGQDWL